MYSHSPPREKFTGDGLENISMVSLTEVGLSKSRNRLLQQATGDVCVFADDDLVYEPDYLDRLEQVYSSMDMDICAFYRKERTIRRRLFNCKTLDLFSISSCEISFRRASIIDKGIYFDEQFGLGSGRYEIAEETIWLHDCLQGNVKIMRYPYHAVSHPHPSSGESVDLNTLAGKGPAFKGMFGAYGYVFLFLFLVKKRPLYTGKENYFRVFYQAVKRARAYKLEK